MRKKNTAQRHPNLNFQVEVFQGYRQREATKNPPTVALLRRLDAVTYRNISVVIERKKDSCRLTTVPMNIFPSIYECSSSVQEYFPCVQYSPVHFACCIIHCLWPSHKPPANLHTSVPSPPQSYHGRSHRSCEQHKRAGRRGAERHRAGAAPWARSAVLVLHARVPVRRCEHGRVDGDGVAALRVRRRERDSRGRRDGAERAAREEDDRSARRGHRDRARVGGLVALHRCHVQRALETAIGLEIIAQSL